MKELLSSTQTLKLTLKHHQTQPRSVGLDADGAERQQAIVNKLAERVAPVVQELEALQYNPHLTDEGRTSKALTIGARIVGTLSFLGNARGDVDQARVRLKALFVPKQPEGNEMVIESRAREIREAIEKRDAGPQYLLALDRGDTETALALLNAPGKSWISDEIRRRGEEAFALKSNPQAWERLQYVEVLRENLSALASQVASWLLLLGASPADVTKATGVAVPQSAKTMQLGEFLNKVAQAK